MSKATQFKIGDLVKCPECSEMDHPFLGRIRLLRQTCAVVEILNFHFKDRQTVDQADFHVTIPFDQLRPVKVVHCGSMRRPG